MKNTMFKRLTFPLLGLVLSANTALCDWHHHGHGSSGASDPSVDAFMWTCVLVLAATMVILFVAGPILVIRLRRIRDLFWVVPLVNTVLYLLSMCLRPYPGGLAARFQPPGLVNTILEIALLLISSLTVALILAMIQWIIRTVRRLSRERNTDTERAAGAAPAKPKPSR